MELVRPAPVRPGATVAVVSPCSPVVFRCDHRAAQARVYPESLGLKVRVMPHSGQAMVGSHVSPSSRAEDLHAAFSDPDVAVVLAAIGGDTPWTEAAGVPELGNVDCGHADPTLTLPLGVRARVDAIAKSFEMLEPALADRPG